MYSLNSEFHGGVFKCLCCTEKYIMHKYTNKYYCRKKLTKCISLRNWYNLNKTVHIISFVTVFIFCKQHIRRVKLYNDEGETDRQIDS